MIAEMEVVHRLSCWWFALICLANEQFGQVDFVASAALQGQVAKVMGPPVRGIDSFTLWDWGGILGSQKIRRGDLIVQYMKRFWMFWPAVKS